jgi:hypothetical protein
MLLGLITQDAFRVLYTGGITGDGVTGTGFGT